MAQQKQQKVVRIFKYSFYLGFVAFIIHFALKLYMGYSALDFKYSPIYYVSWRNLEDIDLGTGCFIPIKKKIDTPGGENVDRYLELVQPNEPKMNNSLYQDFRPDVFLYGKVDQYKLFKNDAEISLEKVFLEARRDFMSKMIQPESYKVVEGDEVIQRQREKYEVVDENIKFENAKQFNSVAREDIVQWIDGSADANAWINQFNAFISNVYSHPDEYKISFENNEISFSEKFETAVKEMINSYNASAGVGDLGLSMNAVKDWVQTIAFCKPKGRGLHALSRVYYLFFYLHSAVTFEDFKTESMQTKLDAVDAIKESDSSEGDKAAKIKRIVKEMNSLRTIYINKAFTYLVAGLFKGDESISFPYGSAQDTRGFFARFYSIPSLPMKEKDIETIESIIKAVKDANVVLSEPEQL